MRAYVGKPCSAFAISAASRRTRSIISFAANNRSLGTRVYDAINAQDLGALETLFDPQVVRHATGETGIEYAKRAMRNAFTAAPNLRFVVEDVLADGDKVALRVSVHGHPSARGPAVPMILEIFRIANDRVVEIWGAGTALQPQPDSARS